MALGSHWSEKEEGQSTKAICRHVKTPAEQSRSEPEHQDHAGSPWGAVAFINQAGQRRGHISICHSPQQESSRFLNTCKASHQRDFSQAIVQELFVPTTTLRYMCMCSTLQRAFCYKPPGAAAKPCWVLQPFGKLT